MSKGVITIIILAIVAVLGAGGYYYMQQQQNGSTVGALVSTTTGAPVTNTVPVGASGDVGKEFLTTLLNLKTLSLDGSLFKSNSYSSLVDSSIILTAPDNVGRVNPFSPIGTDAAVVPATTTPATTTTGALPSGAAGAAALFGTPQ